MKHLFDLAAKRHTEITKIAFLGAALGAGKALLGVMAKNPVKTLGAAFTGAEIAGGAASAASATSKARSLAANTVQSIGQNTI